MKTRTYKMFIEDILESMDKIELYIEGLSYKTFAGNKMVLDAVLRNLEVIGEASKSIPESIRKKYPDIPWKRMIGLRNIAIHEYFGIDTNIIWEIVIRNLPETKPLITEMLKKFDEGKE